METVSIMQRVYGRHVRVPFKYKHVADASEMGVNPSWVARRVVTQGITGLDIEQ